MGMTCTICNHSERLEIDRALVEGKSYQSISKTYGVDAQAVSRHAQNHLSRQLTKAYETRSMSENMDLMNRIDRMIDNAETIFQRNFDKKKDYLALQALNTQKSVIELLAKISAYLHQSRAMELETSAKEDDYEIQQAVSKLELCELELLGKIQDKLVGKIKWERLLPDSFYKDEDDSITINVEPDEDVEHERIVVRPPDEGGSTSIKTDSIVDNFVEGIDTAMEQAEELINPVKDPVQDEPKPTMTRRSPLKKIYYGPNMPKAAARRAAKEYIRNHGSLPPQQWLRDAL